MLTLPAGDYTVMLSGAGFAQQLAVTVEAEVKQRVDGVIEEVSIT